MRKRIKPIATRVAVPKVYPVAYVDPRTLKGADYNPRKMEREELEQLAFNIATVGFIENVTACKEDNELLGGHQRIKAALMLLNGDYVPRDAKGNEFVGWARPEKVPVIYIEGLSRKDRMSINLSLNRIGGAWDHDKVTKVVQAIHADVMADLDAAMKSVDREVAALEAMAMTGFKAAELQGYLTPKGGTTPRNARGVPKLTLEFTSRELRDSFKEWLGSAADFDELPSGDSIAKRLGIGVEKRKPKGRK